MDPKNSPQIQETSTSMARRKSDHIEICEKLTDSKKLQSGSGIGNIPSWNANRQSAMPNHLFSESIFTATHFDEVILPHTSLPKTSPSAVNLKSSLFENSFSSPILITGMTGGVERGQEINETLARLAFERNIPMGLGSQRMMMIDDNFTPLFDVKKKIPGVFLIGNVGAVSLENLARKQFGITADNINKTIAKCKLDAFAFHLNALQEYVQPEGERNFEHVLETLGNVISKIDAPVLIKEVGSGMSKTDIYKLLQLRISALDIAGSGGTSWPAVEGLRSEENSLPRRLGELFKATGISTVQSLWNAKQAILEDSKTCKVNIIGTGGVRNGVHVAKVLALGGSFAGVGLPFFQAVVSKNPWKNLNAEFEFFEESLRIALCSAGYTSVQEIQSLSSNMNKESQQC